MKPIHKSESYEMREINWARKCHCPGSVARTNKYSKKRKKTLMLKTKKLNR